MGYKIAMQTVAETPTFTRQAVKLFTDGEKRELINLLATDPLTGDVIPGTGGVRKLRFGATGTGQVRRPSRLLLPRRRNARLRATGLRQAAKTDLTQAGRRTVAGLAAAIRTETRRTEP